MKSFTEQKVPVDKMLIEIPMGNGSVDRVYVNKSYSPEQIAEQVNAYKAMKSKAPSDVPPAQMEGVEGEKFREKTWPERLGEDAPEMIGSTIGAVLASTPGGGRVGQVAKAVAGAGLGGGIGQTIQDIYYDLFEPEKAPATFGERGKRTLYAGAEQGMWELAGGTMWHTVAAGLNKLRPTVSNTYKEIIEAFEKKGGHLLPQQMTDNWIIKTIGSMSEYSVLGKHYFKKAREQQAKILRDMSTDLATDILSKADNLTSKEVGALYIDAITDGRAAFKGAAQRLYSELDVLVAQKDVVKTVMEEVPSVLLDKTGKALTKIVPKQVQKLVDNAPVDMQSIKVFAKEQMERLERTNISSSDPVYKTWSRMYGQANKMLFGDAQALRSEFLTKSRSKAMTTNIEGEKAAYKQVEKMLEQSMQDAALNSKNPVILNAYKRANKFYKFGKETFNTEFLNKIIKKKDTLAKISDAVFSEGNVDEVLQMRKALRTAGKLDKDFDFNKTWETMQSSYLRRFIAKTKNPDDMLINPKSFGKLFVPDSKANDTFKAAFTAEQRKGVELFYNVAKKVLEKPDSNLGMLVQLTQAGAAGAILTMKGVGVAGASILLTPQIVAKIFTDPKLAKLVVKGMTTRTESKLSTIITRKVLNRLTAEGIKLTTTTGDKVKTTEEQAP